MCSMLLYRDFFLSNGTITSYMRLTYGCCSLAGPILPDGRIRGIFQRGEEDRGAHGELSESDRYGPVF